MVANAVQEAAKAAQKDSRSTDLSTAINTEFDAYGDYYKALARSETTTTVVNPLAQALQHLSTPRPPSVESTSRTIGANCAIATA